MNPKNCIKHVTRINLMKSILKIVSEKEKATRSSFSYADVAGGKAVDDAFITLEKIGLISGYEEDGKDWFSPTVTGNDLKSYMYLLEAAKEAAEWLSDGRATTHGLKEKHVRTSRSNVGEALWMLERIGLADKHGPFYSLSELWWSNQNQRLWIKFDPRPFFVKINTWISLN